MTVLPPAAPTPAPTPAPAGDGELGVFDVIDLMTGYQGAATLTAAARLGVFDLLVQGPRLTEEVSTLLELDPLATRALLDSLVGLHLLHVDDDLYFVTPVAARLTHGGDLRLVAEKEAFFARAWLDLEESVRSGTPRLDPWASRLVSDPAQAREFLRALLVLADETGPDLARLVSPGMRVADLGGGLGAYAVRLAAAGASVTVADLPLVAQWCAEEVPDRVAALGLGAEVAGLVTVRPVDLLAAEAASTLGAGYDVVLLSHLLHDLTDEDCHRVLSLAATILAPGGRVVVFELPGDPPGAFGPMFDLMMEVETPGRARRLSELVGLMTDAGLTGVAVDPAYSLPHGVVVGRPGDTV
ncbi:methyltransferase [Nocardioides houyundeii]|uniref:methyltransferase n=1 Tax=Nocardioides houyundeii TaxID=2045452 RepID=UPI000DF1FD39|nr:methyltransferase dimerization domain-containing protein [Nocardioides houyundeii]